MENKETALVENDADPDSIKNKGCKPAYNCSLKLSIPRTSIMHYFKSYRTDNQSNKLETQAKQLMLLMQRS